MKCYYTRSTCSLFPDGFQQNGILLFSLSLSSLSSSSMLFWVNNLSSSVSSAIFPFSCSEERSVCPARMLEHRVQDSYRKLLSRLGLLAARRSRARRSRKRARVIQGRLSTTAGLNDSWGASTGPLSSSSSLLVRSNLLFSSTRKRPRRWTLCLFLPRESFLFRIVAVSPDFSISDENDWKIRLDGVAWLAFGECQLGG